MAKEKRQTSKAKVKSGVETPSEPVCVVCQPEPVESVSKVKPAGTVIAVKPRVKVEETAPPIEEVVPPVPTTSEVAVASILDGNVFEFEGKVYKKTKQVYSGQVIARRVVGTNPEIVRNTGTAEFPPDIKVIPK